MSLSAYKADAVEAARNRERVEVLADLPDNKVCADCPLLGPRWISINFGVFICLPCSGIHRNLGVHISKVRSVSMDALNDDWVENLERWGNVRANALWQASVPAGYPLPSAADADNQTAVLDRFIRDKYEAHRFKKGGGGTASALVAPHAPTAHAKAKPVSSGGWGDDDDDWGSSAPVPAHAAGRAAPAGARLAPAIVRAPSGDAPPPPPASAAPPPKLSSGAYSTGAMKGFGNPAFENASPRSGSGGGLLSGALSGLVSATASVVTSAVPLVRSSLESTRPLVGNLASGLASYSSTLHEAASFDPARDLQHLRIGRDGDSARSGGSPTVAAGGSDAAGGFGGFGGFGGLCTEQAAQAGGSGRGGFGVDTHGLSERDVAAEARRDDADDDGWGSSGWARSAGAHAHEVAGAGASQPQPAAKQPSGFFGRLRSRSTDSEPPLSRDISDLLAKADGDDNAGRHAPAQPAYEAEPAAAPKPAMGALLSSTDDWAPACPAVSRAGASSGSLKSRRLPAASKAQMAADDDWGKDW